MADVKELSTVQIKPEDRRKYGHDDTNIGFLSTKTRDVKYEKPASAMDDFMRTRWDNIIGLWQQYFHCEDFRFVILLSCALQEWIIKSAGVRPELELIIIKGDDLRNPPVLPRDSKQVILCGWEPCDNVDYWIDHGWVEPSWGVYAIAKDLKRREKIAKAAHHIELWADAEDRSGLKFPGCTQYHLLSREQVTDDDNVFTESAEGCKCGIRGQTFTVRQLIASPVRR